MKEYQVFIVLLIVFGLFIGGRHLYFKPKFVNGEPAPKFTAELIDGETFSLKDLRGSYVLIDFWGSWCGPCRQENPDLVALYHKYHDRTFRNADSFAIVSVAIETSPRQWKQAIERDRLNWKYHIGQFERFDSPVVSKFGVREIPTKYLINPRGEIIGVNLSAREMDQMLGERIAD